MHRFFSSPYFFWAILVVPSIPMVARFASDPANAEFLLHPTGEFAARFMIIAMALTPLRLLFPGAKWLYWLMRRRRWLGVAAFGYAMLHTLFYVVDMGSLALMADEFLALGIWTGWAAFAIFLPLAATSNDFLQRRLGGAWKPLQRLTYAAAALTLVHWVAIHDNLAAALLHFLPLAALEANRLRVQLLPPRSSSRPLHS